MINGTDSDFDPLYEERCFLKKWGHCIHIHTHHVVHTCIYILNLIIHARTHTYTHASALHRRVILLIFRLRFGPVDLGYCFIKQCYGTLLKIQKWKLSFKFSHASAPYWWVILFSRLRLKFGSVYLGYNDLYNTCGCSKKIKIIVQIRRAARRQYTYMYGCIFMYVCMHV